jgi:hypothetical protein
VGRGGGVVSEPYAQGKRWTIHHGDALDWLAASPDDHADIVVTDSPYSINTKSDGEGKLNPWADYCNAALWYTTWIRDVRARPAPSRRPMGLPELEVAGAVPEGGL